MTKQQRIAAGVITTLSLLVFCAYFNSLDGEFVYDDVFFIKESPLIRDLANVGTMFTSAFWEASSHPSKAYYRPLTVFSYALNHAVGGYQPWGYHLVNVLVHLGNTLLVYALLTGVTRRRLLAGVTALFFGLHPINTEVVAWVSGRGDVMSTFFYLCALVFYVRARPPESGNDAPARPARVAIVLSLTAFCLALFAKESAITLVAVLVLYEFCFRASLRKMVISLVPFVIVVFAYLGCRMAVLDGLQVTRVAFVANPLIDESPAGQLLTGIKLFGKYLALFLFPARLSVDYSYNQIPIARTLLAPGVIAALLAALATVGLWVVSWKRHRVAFFGLGLFFLTGGLIFANAFSPFTAIFGERFMYLPGIGLIVAIVALGSALLERVLRRPRPAVVGCLVIIVAGCFFARTWSRNRDWRDEYTLFVRAAEVCPDSVLINFALANEHYKRGEYDLATQRYQRTLDIHPDFASGFGGLGNVALARRDFQAAVEYLTKALNMGSASDETYVLLGAAYGGLGQLDEAQRATEHALELNPSNSQTHNNLANIHYLQGDFDRALASWRRAVEINPFNAQALYNLAANYEKRGAAALAVEFYTKFLDVAPARLNEAKANARSKIAALQGG